MTWGEFLMKKFSVDRYTFSVNTSHHDSGRRLREVEFYFKLKKKQQEVLMVILHAMCLTLKWQ